MRLSHFMEEHMQIVYRGVEEITPYEHNPRKNDEAVDAVAASIEEFGFKVPIVIDKDGVIVAGHTRLKAAKKLGLTEVPCVVADDLTDEQVRAFRLADNKVSEFSKWITDKLKQEIDGISIDMTQFGVNLNEIPDYDGLFAEAEQKEKQAKTITCPCCGKEFTR